MRTQGSRSRQSKQEQKCTRSGTGWCSYRPVYHASRKLSKVKWRYSQFEKEALAVRWACQKFYLFLYGIDFEICTDHKPLIAVLSAKSTPRQHAF